MKTTFEELMKVPMLGDWMYDTNHKPTIEEIEELMWIVEGDPEEFDFDIVDIKDRCVKIFKMDSEELGALVFKIAVLSE